MKKQWRIMAKKVDFDTYAKELNVSPLMVRLLCNRDLMTVSEMRKFLYGDLKDLHSPYLMKDAKKAMEIMFQSIEDDKSIRVIGDYDVDGVTSTYILEKGISAIGGRVSRDIPERMTDGYGLNERLIHEAIRDKVDVIITCDNGIAAKEEIALAKKNGIVVIVTDHHEVPYDEVDGERIEILPNADAIVDPKRKNDEYPYKEICGALIAMKCMQILLDIASQNNRIDDVSKATVLEEMIEFAALGTVCDVMPLRDENRIIVKEGLRLLQHAKNLGLRTLINENSLCDKELKCYHLGFVIGPCINAMGRLGEAKKGLALFETSDEGKAKSIAQDLIMINEERKDMTEQGVNDAMQQVDTLYSEDKVLVVYLPDCHESIAGIIAGRVREKYNKPCLIVTKSKDGLKGSGRSIDVYHMRDGLQGVQELLTKFGGHKLAAGFSLLPENLDEFRRQINEQANLTEEDFVCHIMLEMDLPITEATIAFVESLSMLEPFGMMNESPLFGRNDLTLEQVKEVGQKGNAVKCKIKSASGKSVDGIYFGDAKAFIEDVNKPYRKLLLAYSPKVNEFRDTRSVQLHIKYYEIIE